MLDGPETVHTLNADVYNVAHDSSAAVASAGRAPPPVAAARIAVMTWSVRLDRCSTAGRCHGHLMAAPTPPPAGRATTSAKLVHQGEGRATRRPHG